jgi:lipopolysaccharide transport system ATP-binding protein
MQVNQHSRVLSLRDVGLSYVQRIGLFKRKRFWALKSISFDLYHGETLGLIGRNGAGKSTLLRLLAGIIDAEQGEIISDDSQASLLSLQIGFIPHLTGRTNAILSGMLLGLQRNEVESMMAQIIQFSELENFIDQPIRTYSSGMKARLGFSVAFKADPDILLVDEVLGVGDEEFRKKSATAIQEKIRSNKTVVLVSHAPQVIRQLCDRVVWIEKGVVKMEDEAGIVMDAYLADVNKPKATAR